MPLEQNVLLVDDDPITREEVSSFLGSQQFAVKQARNGVEGLDHLRSGYRPDVILLDLRMPVMDGREMHAELQSNADWASIPIVLVTGATRGTVALDVEAVLAKPFSLDKLLRVVRDLCPTEAGLCRVLLVEDDEDIRENSAELLRSSGFTVTTAADGAEALERLATGWLPDLLLTDLMMPNVSGWELLEQLKQRPEWADIPVVVASGTTSSLDDGMRVEGLVPKPIDYQLLVSFLNKAFARKTRRTAKRLMQAASKPTPQAASARRPDERARFFAAVAHELRGPLQVMTSSTHMLQQSPLLTEREQRNARAAMSSARRMSRLIEDLLDFMEAEARGFFNVRREPCDLAAVCRATTDELRTGAPTRAIELTTPPAVTGLWDGARMAQVLTNLVQNALKYGEPGAPVEVSLAKEEDAVLLRVANRGDPIPDEALPTLFDPFTRAVANTDRRPGVGLGLAVVRQIAFAHGGAVDVESTPEQTVFSVVLPLVGVGDAQAC